MLNKLISFLFFLFGIILFFFSKDDFFTVTDNNNLNTNISFYNKMEYFKDYKILGVFISNLTVGFLLSIVGYFTGGLLTILILIWNGFLVAMVYNMAYYLLPMNTILYATKHAPFEIYAFLIFADFGLKGRLFVKKILVNNEINLTIFPSLKNLIFPIILLFFASILEVI